MLERAVMQSNNAEAGRPITAVFIDHSSQHQIRFAERFAAYVQDINIVLITDKSPSRIDGNFEVINVMDVRQNLTLDEMQRRFGFSLYRTLVAERAYFDYSTFTARECYSRVDLAQIGELIRPHVNALDEKIRTRADLVIGHLADNAIASLAANIAAHYGKPYAAPFPFYWWPDGFIFIDRPDQTSSEVDHAYRYFYANPAVIDRDVITRIYKGSRVNFAYSDNVTFPLRERLKKVFASRNWHEPFSLGNWIVRRVVYCASQVMIASVTRSYSHLETGQRFVLFPLHVSPEASLLGSTPELADQFSLIKDISINLPWSIHLYVKKHPGQKKWTGPNFDFFHKLRALKNVRVIDAGMPMDDIIADTNCLAVATINGTVAIEAGLRRKPVFVFGKAIYGVADCFIKPKDFDEFRARIASIANGEFKFDDEALFSILAALNAAVWRGDNDFAIAKTVKEASLRSFSSLERYIRREQWRKPASRRELPNLAFLQPHG